nr:LysM peptidoglycan-binding domain-containing protein [Vagococcus allomyrinae]
MVLDRVTFGQPFGEIVGVIGSKGAGKTTLGSILLGEISPSEGFVSGSVEQVRRLSLPDSRNGHQTGELYIHKQLVEWGVPRKKLSELSTKISEFSELGPRLSDTISHYTLEEQAQLSISLLLHMTPTMIYIEEELLVVKEDFFIKVFLFLEKLKVMGASIWIETETIKRIESYCDKLVWLEFGKLMKYGDVLEVLLAYDDYYFNIQRMSHNEQQTFWSEGYQLQLRKQMHSKKDTSKEINLVEEKKEEELSLQLDKEPTIDDPLLLTSPPTSKGERGEGLIKTRAQKNKKSPHVKSLRKVAILAGLLGGCGMLVVFSLPKEDVTVSVSHRSTSQSITTPTFSTVMPTFDSTSSVELPQTSQTDKQHQHLVTSGETLSLIAANYGVTLDALQQANNLTDTTIYAGTYLTLPKEAILSIMSEEESKESTDNEVVEPELSEPAPLDHIVVKGESLYKIAQQYQVDVMAIQAANHLQTEELSPGQMLIIPH